MALNIKISYNVAKKFLTIVILIIDDINIENTRKEFI